jgi:hypothetical protein
MVVRPIELKGLYIGLLGYQLVYRCSAQWNDSLPCRRRGCRTHALKCEFDRRVTSVVFAVLLLGTCLPLWLDPELRDQDRSPLHCQTGLRFPLAVAVGFLGADLIYTLANNQRRGR